jgi:hypothetical protein
MRISMVIVIIYYHLDFLQHNIGKNISSVIGVGIIISWDRNISTRFVNGVFGQKA